MIYGLGMLESGITFDYGQLVLDNEFARMIKHTVRGFPVEEEALALDVIAEIGPGGHYLMHKHTLAGMRSQSNPEMIDRRVRAAWEKSGATTVYERAAEKARWILENHRRKPLSQEVLQAIRSIVERTEREMGIERS